MRVDDLILELQDMVNDAKAVPLSRDKKVLISSDRVLYILDEIDEALPTEIRQAEERRKIMVSEHEITKAAEAQAREIVTDAKKKASEITKAANNYVDDIMKRTDELITGCAQDIRKARQSFKQSKK